MSNTRTRTRAAQTPARTTNMEGRQRSRLALIVTVPILLALLASSCLATDIPARARCMDHIVRALSESPSAQRHGLAVSLGVADGSADEVSVVFEYTGDPDQLRMAGARPRSRVGNIYTADIPLENLDAVTALSGMTYIRAPRLFHPMLDVSVPDTGASALRSGTPPAWKGYTGKGVIVGMVESGVDPDHLDFRDSAGNTRILYIWDQTTGTGGANHPAGYTYGTEWTSAQINAGQCTQKDTAGHGTAVTSIAAGNGQATGYGWPAYRYVGVAPEAEIIMVKSTFYDDTIVDAMNYIKGKANSLGKPFVVNLSIGSQYGAHDGTDLLERTIDSFVGQGAVVCTATGNNRSSDTAHYVHADLVVPTKNSTATATLNVPSNRANPFYVDMWYQGGDSIDVKVTTPNGYSITKSTGTTTGGYYSTPDGGIWLENAYGGNDPYNGDRECIVAVQNAVAGIWSITATGKTITQGGACDAWTQVGHNVYWATAGNNAKTCSIPGTSNAVITVGGYMTKTRWANPDGTQQGWNSVFGSFYPSSGEGPTRDGRQKPDIAVPTSRIAAALSTDCTPTATDIVEDGVHSVQTGTSMAVPHAVGAVALMLQKDPLATAAEIKSRFNSTARTDSLTGTCPNYQWGYGKLTLVPAMALTPLNTNPTVARTQPDGALVKLVDQVVSAGYTQMGDRFYVESSDRSGGVQVRIASGTQPGEKDKVLVVGTVNNHDGERAITNSTVTRTGIGTGTVPDPVAMPNRSVGGTTCGVVPGIKEGTGLNNIGLLVTTWGKVTYIGSDYFRVLDKSAINSDSTYREIKVRCGSLTKPTSTNQCAIVTGISSLELSGSDAIPVIRVRKQADLLYYNLP